MDPTQYESRGFWSGVIPESKKVLSIIPGATLNILHISLSTSISGGLARNTVRLSYRPVGATSGQYMTVIANLSVNHVEQVYCDVRLFQGFEYVLDSQGNNAIHLSGRFLTEDDSKRCPRTTMRMIVRNSAAERAAPQPNAVASGSRITQEADNDNVDGPSKRRRLGIHIKQERPSDSELAEQLDEVEQSSAYEGESEEYDKPVVRKSMKSAKGKGRAPVSMRRK